jgi:hypothetical protein
MMQKGYNGMIDYRYMFAEFVNLAEEKYWCYQNHNFK